MKRSLCFLCVLCVSVVSSSAQEADDEHELQMTLAEAGNSDIDLIRGLERYLEKHPKSSRRPELERALTKAAIQIKDEARIVRWGERVLAREPDDLQILERVSRALLTGNDAAPAERALKYLRRYEEGIRKIEAEKRPGGMGLSRWRDEIDRGLGRAHVLQSRATGNLGRIEEALALARKSYDTYPSAESAREIGRWLQRGGHEEEAIRQYAEAFAIPDSRTRDSDRAGDRARMGELYRKLHGSEKGLGDLILEAFDRTTTRVKERELKLKQLDPNAELTDPMQFTLTAIDGRKLPMQSLKGKVVVLDFWATWCGPCRVQHPLYERVKQHFRNRPEVVFLSINADEDREGVPEFIAENHWDRTVYYEDGLSAALRVSSIPTAILINKRGEIESRMNGFNPELFVDMLSERIEQALSR